MALLRPRGGFRPVTLAVLVSALTSCAVTRGEGDFADRDGAMAADHGPEGDATLGGGAATHLEDPDGWWLLFAQDRQCIYAVGDPLENIVRSTYVMRLRRERSDGTFLRQRVRMCAHELSPLHFGFVTVVGHEIPDAQPTHDVAGFLLGPAPGEVYVTGEVVDNWGVPGLPTDAPLPATADDPRVVDQDEDGLPGVTATVTTPDGTPICTVQLVERLRVTLEGAVVNARHIEGLLVSHIEQVVLSASTDLCASGELGDSLAETRFDMVRIDGKDGAPNLDADRDGEIDCVEVRAGQEETLSFYGLLRAQPDSESNCP